MTLATGKGYTRFLSGVECIEAAQISSIWRPFYLILIIEDELPLAHALQQALREVGVTDDTMVLEDAESAVHYLSAQPPYQNRPVPRLILLDLSLPLMGGLELLYWLRAFEEFAVSRTPVIVLEDSPELIAMAYDGGANSVFARADGGALLEQMRTLDEFWRACESPR